MIELFTWNTPNGQKPVILLEELGLEYTLNPVNIRNGDQHQPDFRSISPNGKIPALRDGGITIFESGAILLHLALKQGRFLGESEQERAQAMAWSFWQVGSLGPMIGQWGHFQMANEKLPYAIDRFRSEVIRLFEVLEGRLGESEYVAGPNYTIADIMTYPWASGGLNFLRQAGATGLPDLRNAQTWIDRIAQRPAARAAVQKLSKL